MNAIELAEAMRINASNRMTVVVKMPDGTRLPVEDWDFEDHPTNGSLGVFIIHVTEQEKELR